MSNAKITIFSKDVAHAVADNVTRTGAEFRYVGVLDQSLDIDDTDTDFATWIALAVRSGSMTLTIAYSLDTEVFTVDIDTPALIMTRADDTITTITIAPVGLSAEVEVLTYTSNQELNPPSPAYLHLNAGLGITEDPFLDDSVTSWKDVREVSLAPLDFDWGDDTKTEPVLIASDSTFNNKPSVDFSSAGDSIFDYSGADSVFSFMRGDVTDFTMLMVLSAPDDATNEVGDQGIWNTSNATSINGWRALIDPAYRHNTILAGVGTEVTGTDELSEKATIMIWNFDASADELRVYWQGRWHAVETFTGQASGTDPTALQVGGSPEAAHVMKFFRGKIADLRLYNRLLTATELSTYIAGAVTTYGIADTEVQGFPYILSLVNFHRANRGATWEDEEETNISTWNDTRPEVDSDAQVFVEGPGTSPTYANSDVLFNSEPAWQFDGVSDLITNTFSNTTGDHFAGATPGFTLAIVYYSSGSSNQALFSQGAYNSITLEGTTIFFNSSANKLTYETDNSANADVVKELGAETGTDVARMVVYRGDGANWWIDELDLTTNVLTSSTGLYSGAESSATSSAVFMFAFTDNSGFLEGGLAEMSSVATKKTNAEVAVLLDYARARYGTFT